MRSTARTMYSIWAAFLAKALETKMKSTRRRARHRLCRVHGCERRATVRGYGLAEAGVMSRNAAYFTSQDDNL